LFPSIQKIGGVKRMRYAIAWLLGVPVSIILVWFVVGHLL